MRPDEQLEKWQWWGRYSIRHHVSKEAQDIMKKSKFSFYRKKEECKNGL